MILTQKQQQGLEIAVTRYKNHEKYTCISGYAGSGKSTLVKFIIEALQVDPKRVCYASFTGKAAQVLLKKGNKNALTLHKLLYEHYPRPDGGYYRVPRITIDYDVVVVDEVSMAPKELMDLLFTHHAYVICLGDPGQLPPINKNDDNGLLAHPHIFLDEIMRQAQESEIIRLSMDIRAGKSIPFYNGNEVKVLKKSDLNEGMLLWADQILVATNAQRIAINSQMRQLLGRGDRLEEGDKVICLKNYWDEIADNGDALVNGTIGTIHNCFKTYVQIPFYLGGQRFDITNAVFKSDSDADFGPLNMDQKMILTGQKCCDGPTAYRLSRNKMTRNAVPLEFTYGYAVTSHKFQGSETEKVLVLEENFPFSAEEHRRWLYTSVTRASEKLVLVKKD